MRPKLTHDIYREHGAAITSFLRFALIMVVVAMTIIAVGEALRPQGTDVTVAPATPSSDPLAADLARCRDIIAEQLAADDTCRHVWAENRRGFFTPRPSAETR